VSTDGRTVSQRELARVLQSHVSDGMTGTVFIRTSENHLGCVGLRDGALVSLLCRGVKGPKALTMLLAAQGMTVRFDDSQVMGEGGKSPGYGAQEVIAALESGAARAPTQQPVRAVASAPRPRPAPRPESAGPALDASDLDFVRAQAANALGPVGPMLIDEFIAKHGSSAAGVRAAAEEFSRDIGEGTTAFAFKEAIASRIGTG
jgi:hypothetical protein